MFRQIYTPANANNLFVLHPAQIAVLLENQWNRRSSAAPPVRFGSPAWRSSLPGVTSAIAGILPRAAFLPATRTFRSDHLIYAYMIENTRVYEVFRRVLHEFLHGERLGVPTPAAQDWLRNTEELFYHDPTPFLITSIASHIRSDMRASRRNAYHRMFGMDLNHGTDDNQPYSYTRADASNTDFVATFEALLREVWIGITNAQNAIGVRPIDDGKILDLLGKLEDMLTARRMSGNLSREEFTFVAMMSWFHLTLEFDSPIILALRADATSPEQRLFKVAQRVGLPAHGLSHSLFEIADAISAVLNTIETGLLRNLAAAQRLYSTPGSPPLPPNPLQTAMTTIITHWSIITGRDMKANPVAAQPWQNGKPSALPVPQREVKPRESAMTETARF